VGAYQNAAGTLAGLHQSVRRIEAEEGIEGLIALPTIGRSIANLIHQWLRLGRMPLLDRLRGDDTAERLFATVPMMGPELSHRVHQHLDIETLPELLAAAVDGSLQRVPGIGRKRAAAIRQCLRERLAIRRGDGPQTGFEGKTDRSVSIDELLDIDAQYRRLVREDKLPRIAPRKFNPGHVAWLPILHTQRDHRHYTVLFSNTARAHELNTTRDWVIIYRDDPQAHGRWTVITSQFGRLHGCRIVRGREDECLDFYVGGGDN
jgi:hypothetical protein